MNSLGLLRRQMVAELGKSEATIERQHQTIKRMAKTIIKLKEQIARHHCIMGSTQGGH